MSTSRSAKRSALYALKCRPKRRHRLLQHVPAPTKRCPTSCGGNCRPSLPGMTRAATAPASCAALCRCRPTRRRRSAPSTRWSAPIGDRPAGAVSSAPPQCLYPGPAAHRQRELLDALWAHSTKDEFNWYQQGARGDLILWTIAASCIARRLRPGDPARHAPHPDQGRPPV